MSLHYGWEKFFIAVSDAASSEKTLQERLRDAYVYNLMYVREENLPPDVWTELRELHQVITARPAEGDEGTVAATTAVMSDEEASKWLRKVVAWFSEICQAHGADKERR